MTYKEYTEEFINHYKLDGLLDYKRTCGPNLKFKKILIHILRTKFHISYELISELFHNDHATIMYHFKIGLIDSDMERVAEDAWKLYRD